MPEPWEGLHPEILHACRDIAETGKYDDAIFAAFRIVEGEIQTRIQSAGIASNLLDEAFDGPSPKIDISPDPRDRAAIKQLFSGALGNIRNDRGHKKAPLTQCKTGRECILYLQFATLLLELLDKDRNTFPLIVGVRVYGTHQNPLVEIRGRNFGPSPSILTPVGSAQVNRLQGDVIEVALPAAFSGELRVARGDKESKPVFCDSKLVGSERTSSYRVLATDLPLYSDEKAVTPRPNVIGLLLLANEGGTEFQRIIPTYRGRYGAGDYVTHGPFETTGIGATWYRPPGEERIEKAWDGALIAVPNVIGRSSGCVIGGISIRPSPVRTQLNERRALRAIAWESDGPAGREVDVSERVVWSTADSAIAHAARSVLIPKALGKTQISCSYEGFEAKTNVVVEHVPRNEAVIFFQGLRRLQQIRFATDGSLFLCNQSASVYRIGTDGVFSTVLRLSVPETAVHVISCLAIDERDRLYVNDLTRNACHRFDWDGTKFLNGVQLAANTSGSKQSIAINSNGQAFIAVMGPVPNSGWVVRVDPDGHEVVFPTRDTAIHLAIDKNDCVYVSNTKCRSVDLYDSNGEMGDEITHGERDSISDLALDTRGNLYLAFFRSGKIGRISHLKKATVPQYLPGNFGTPGGVAVDQNDRVYISDFGGDSIALVY